MLLRHHVTCATQALLGPCPAHHACAAKQVSQRLDPYPFDCNSLLFMVHVTLPESLLRSKSLLRSLRNGSVSSCTMQQCGLPRLCRGHCCWLHLACLCVQHSLPAPSGSADCASVRALMSFLTRGRLPQLQKDCRLYTLIKALYHSAGSDVVGCLLLHWRCQAKTLL